MRTAIFSLILMGVLAGALYLLVQGEQGMAISKAPLCPAGLSTATFGAGCFWGVEKHFQEIPGVRETTVGFTGGTLANPRYKNVCDGGTGHAEAVEIFFDPRAISYEDLVKELFRLHSPGVPSTLRDGQYRTAIFYHDQGQKEIAGKVLAEYERITGGKADVSIVKAGIFFPAEEYHQDYYRKNGGKCPAPVNEQIFSSSPSSR